MDVKALQRALLAAGYDPGPIDGGLGKRTYAALLRLAAGRQLGALGLALGEALAGEAVAAGLTTSLRLAHFLAQASHETLGFRYLSEIWGPTPAQKRYEGRADLGNTQPGDGSLFRGRGIFQLTGRANYARYGALIGIDLVANPVRAAEPAIAVQTATEYWKDGGLNALADRDDVRAITKRINGGFNGLAERTAILNRVKAVLL